MDDIYEEVEFKEINREKKVRKKKHYLLRFLIFIGIIVAIGAFLASPFFKINKIEVTGNSYYTDDEVITMADAKTGGNIFWGTGSSEIKARLEVDPYFEEVSVKRSLPKTLVIEVKERNQVAAIRYGDKYVVIDGKGLVLRKSKEDPKVTIISGLKISKLEIGSEVEATESENLKMTLEMLNKMTDGDIYFKKIVLSNAVIKAYFLDTLLVKGTPKQINKVIESGELKKVVNNLLKNETVRGTINIGDANYMSFSPKF